MQCTGLLLSQDWNWWLHTSRWHEPPGSISNPQTENRVRNGKMGRENRAKTSGGYSCVGVCTKWMGISKPQFILFSMIQSSIFCPSRTPASPHWLSQFNPFSLSNSLRPNSTLQTFSPFVHSWPCFHLIHNYFPSTTSLIPCPIPSLHSLTPNLNFSRHSQLNLPIKHCFYPSLGVPLKLPFILGLQCLGEEDHAFCLVV